MTNVHFFSNQLNEEHLKPYQQYLEDLTKTFDKIEYRIFPRAQNQFADSLATLACMVEVREYRHDPWRLSKVMRKCTKRRLKLH